MREENIDHDSRAINALSPQQNDKDIKSVAKIDLDTERGMDEKDKGGRRDGGKERKIEEEHN